MESARNMDSLPRTQGAGRGAVIGFGGEMNYRVKDDIAYCQDRHCINANGRQAPVVNTAQHDRWHATQPLALFIAGQRPTNRVRGVVGFYENRRANK